MEFTAPSAGEMTVVRALREDLEIGLGCVSVQSGSIDTVETIVARVERALEYLAPERITPNPDCGFAPGSGAVGDMDEVYQQVAERGPSRASSSRTPLLTPLVQELLC